MADRALRRCTEPLCPHSCEPRSSKCAQHQPRTQSFTPQVRKVKDPFYGTAAWLRCRAHVLDLEPLCRVCQAPATHVDHIVARAQGGEPFELANLQPLCHSCHSRKTLTEQHAGRRA